MYGLLMAISIGIIFGFGVGGQIAYNSTKAEYTQFCVEYHAKTMLLSDSRAKCAQILKKQ